MGSVEPWDSYKILPVEMVEIPGFGTQREMPKYRFKDKKNERIASLN